MAQLPVLVAIRLPDSVVVKNQFLLRALAVEVLLVAAPACSAVEVGILRSTKAGTILLATGHFSFLPTPSAVMKLQSLDRAQASGDPVERNNARSGVKLALLSDPVACLS